MSKTKTILQSVDVLKRVKCLKDILKIQLLDRANFDSSFVDDC